MVRVGRVPVGDVIGKGALEPRRRGELVERQRAHVEREEAVRLLGAASGGLVRFEGEGTATRMGAWGAVGAPPRMISRSRVPSFDIVRPTASA